MEDGEDVEEEEEEEVPLRKKKVPPKMVREHTTTNTKDNNYTKQWLTNVGTSHVAHTQSTTHNATAQP